MRPAQNPPTNVAQLILGSATVLIGGKPAVRDMDLGYVWARCDAARARSLAPVG